MAQDYLEKFARGRISSGKAEVAAGLASVDATTGARTRASVPERVEAAFLDHPEVGREGGTPEVRSI